MRFLQLSVCVASLSAATHVKDLCHKGLCGAAQTVGIPQFTTIASAKPIFHQHGLIKVQLPPQQTPILAPAAITTAQQFAVGTPRLGKVVDRTEPTYFCKKPGYILEGQTCVSTAVQPANFVCPGGFETFDGRCVRRAQILETCPAGYARRDGHCAKLITAAFIPVCPPDSDELAPGVCSRRVPHPLSPTCPEGTYDARTGNCIVSAFAEAQAFCPEGFTFTDGACIQEEVYDCSHQALGLQTVPQLGQIHAVPQLGHPVHHGHDLRGHGHEGHVKGRILHAKKGYGVPVVAQQQQVPVIVQQQPCVTAAVAPCAPPPPPPCTQAIAVAARVQPCETQPQVVVQTTKTTVSVQKTCTRVTSTALVFACEQGILQGQRCLIKQAVPATPVCTAQGDVGNCFSTLNVAPLQECPADFSRECLPGRPCECAALEAAALMTSCPTGYDAFEAACGRTAEIVPTCPPGFALQGAECVRVLREPADCVFSVTYECDHATGRNCQNF